MYIKLNDTDIDTEKVFNLIKRKFLDDDVSDRTKGCSLISQYEKLDDHGKGILNWFMISLTGYSLHSYIETFQTGIIIENIKSSFPLNEI